MKKWFMPIMLAAAVLAFATLITPASRPQDAPRRIEVIAKRFSYDPGEITLKKGEPVVLVIKSADVAHGLQVRELKIDVKVGAGETAEVQFTPQKTGTFIGHCSVFCGAGHGSMKLTLRVVD
ncbi:MAG: cupredoxin domain-containing protein [Terracidiphilus sp.]